MTETFSRCAAVCVAHGAAGVAVPGFADPRSGGAAQVPAAVGGGISRQMGSTICGALTSSLTPPPQNIAPNFYSKPQPPVGPAGPGPPSFWGLLLFPNLPSLFTTTRNPRPAQSLIASGLGL